jgi:hypothetical protein
VQLTPMIDTKVLIQKAYDLYPQDVEGLDKTYDLKFKSYTAQRFNR